MRMYPSRRGFTLMEILIVMLITAILATIGYTSYANTQKKGRDNKRKTDLAQMQRALEAYINDYGTYPRSDTEGRILGCEDGTIACQWGESFATHIGEDNETIYLAKLPKDNVYGLSYNYEFIEPNGYRIYSRLENTKDLDVIKQTDGTPGQFEKQCGATHCNYVVTSENVSVPAPYIIIVTNTPTQRPTNTPTQRPTNTPTQRPTNTPTPTPSCLALHWALEDTGTTITDSSGNGRNGVTVYGPPGTSIGKIGNARTFNRMTGGQDIRSVSPYIRPKNQPFAVSVWVRPWALSQFELQDYTHAIIGHGYQTGIGRGWYLATGGFWGQYNFACRGGDENGTPIGINSPTAIECTPWECNQQNLCFCHNWYHIAMVYDGTNATCYINGTSIGTQPMNIPATNGYIAVGRAWYNYDYYFAKATIDEVKIWEGSTACSVNILRQNVINEYNRGR